MECKTIEDALKHCNEVTELFLNGDECKKAYTNDIEKLTNLKTLHFFPGLKDWTSFPEGFKKLNIEVLRVKGIRINELVGIKIKNLTIQIANIDILPLCKNFPELEELSISVGGDFEIPKEIEQLSKLKTLEISQGTLTKVASEITNLKALEVLKLNALKFETLPLEFTTITNLNTVVIYNFPKLTSLPEEIKNWKELENLSIQDCFKNRNKMGIEDSLFHEDKPIELPAAIAGLKKLKDIKIVFCPIKHLDALAELTELRKIEVIQASITNINALKKLTKLTKLVLGHSYDVSSIDSLSELVNLEYLDISDMEIDNLKPLTKLTKLEYLKISDCAFDTSKSKVQDALLPLYALENLKEVIADKISQEEWENRDPKEALKKRLTPQEIISVLDNKKSSLTAVEEALNAIGDLETVFNVSKHDVDDSTLEIEVLDTAVSSNIGELSDKTLQKLVSVSFADTGMCDSYEVTVIVVTEIIKRKCIAGQKHVVKAFINCTTYYDAGHRFYGSTVHDSLIDDFFPEFELEPLVELMLSIDDALLHPEYGDNMCSLYPCIFAKKANGEDEERILAHLKSYIFENMEEEMLLEILDEILEKDISEKSKQAVKGLKNVTQVVNNAIEGESTEAFNTMLEAVNKSLPLKVFKALDFEEAFNTLDLHALSYDLLCNGFTQLVALKEGNATHQIMKVLYVLEPVNLEKYLFNLAKEDEGVKGYLIKILGKTVSSDEAEYVNKTDYEAFAQITQYTLQGKTVEEAKIELAEKEEARLKKETANKQKKELKETFNQSMSASDNSIFINKSQEAVKNEPLNDYSFDMANYTTKLLINSLQKGDFESAKKVIFNFTEKLLPVVGSSSKLDDVASNSLVMAIMSKDIEVEALVFNKLLPANFKATDINNEVLAFNLSCYYAVKSDKQNMLAIIKQALNLGKTTNQFKTDSDFSKFWEDQDFIELLKD